VFDFDGTLSLLRGNWQGLMVPMMVELLAATGTRETRAELTALVEEFVTRLTGQPTMQQMLALVAAIRERGGEPAPPEAYLEQYLEQLLARTAERIDAVESGRGPADEFLLAGSRPLIDRLQQAGWILAIASGTELAHVRREARILGIDDYFGPRIFGPVANDPRFSKEEVLRLLMAEHGLAAHQIAAIGDGPAEMVAAKAIGALTVGVASDEVHLDGRVNRLKREHLLRAGADVIVPDYRDLPSVLNVLGLEVGG
jgi:phosphoglycolate phosphatase